MRVTPGQGSQGRVIAPSTSPALEAATQGTGIDPGPGSQGTGSPGLARSRVISTKAERPSQGVKGLSTPERTAVGGGGDCRWWQYKA